MVLQSPFFTLYLKFSDSCRRDLDFVFTYGCISISVAPPESVPDSLETALLVVGHLSSHGHVHQTVGPFRFKTTTTIKVCF